MALRSRVVDRATTENIHYSADQLLMADMAPHDEIELKFELDARAARKVRSSSLLRKAEDETLSQRTVYFDVASRKLHKKGYSLRVRQVGDRFTQTVKTNSRAAGLLDRREWEVPVSRMEPDQAALQQTPLARIKDLDRLEPVAQSDVRRTRWTLDCDSNEIEVVLDSGRLRAGGRKARFHELEIELKDGDARAIFTVAHQLSRAAALEVGVLGKEERGFMLAQSTLGRCQKASAVDVRKDMDVGQAVVLIVHECIRHFRLNEPAIVVDRDPEALHQARVAIRRLRTVFSFFRSAIRGDALDPIRKELRNFMVPFGKARNLDVFLAHHEEHLSSGDRRKLKRARDEAYDQVIEVLGAKRTRDMFLGLVEWAVARDWQKDRANEPIGKFATRRLDVMWKKTRRKGSILADLEGRQLHRLRINVKKLRYAVEFMAALYSKKATGKFISSLERIQDCFGLLHDDMVARQLIDDYSLDFRPSTKGGRQSRRLKAAEAHFKRLKRSGRVWSR